MHTCFNDDDTADYLMERRWFAIDRAAARLENECATLAAVLKMAEDAWRGARSRLVELEAIRDALGQEMVRRRHAAEPPLRETPLSNREGAVESIVSAA